MTRDLGAPAPSTVTVVDPARVDELLAGVRANLTPSDYEAKVESAKEDIRAGEVFQVVLSQRFTIDCPADALDVKVTPTTFVFKRGRGAGYAGVENPLFFKPKTRMMYGDAKSSVDAILKLLKD
jgi:hypothetical protein